MRRLAPTDVAVPLLAAAAALLTLLSWSGLAEAPGDYLVPLFWVALGTAVLGVALRSLALPLVLVPVVQALAVLLVLHHQWTSGGLLGGWVPTPESLQLLRQVVELSAETASRHSAPVPADEPMFGPLMVVVGAVVILAVDALAATFRRAPAAGLPLLAAFTVPVSLLDGVSWLTFALTAAAFVLLLAAEQAATLGRWGRSVGPDHGVDRAGEGGTGGAGGAVRLSSLWPAATRVGAVGIGVAVVAPLLVPAGDGWFGGQDGPGSGVGGDQVTLDNPFVDIRRDLVQQRDVDLVTAVTDDPDPSYLRLTVLDEFDGDSWRPSERSIPPDNRADGPLPLPFGLSSTVEGSTYQWQLAIDRRFDSTWLPAPYPAVEVEATGDWRYDVDTLDLVAADDSDAAGLRYRASGFEPTLEPAQLVAADGAGRVAALTDTRLPDSVPDWVGALAEDVTASATSNFEQARLLQRWFREDGGFTYSLEPAPGNGVDDLETFLGQGPDSRVGYCEQFSAAMALMARTLDIPARVAMGFLTPSRSDTGEWVYSSKDLHAWPELFFPGAGWVRFEPTPSVRTGSAPDYTEDAVAAPEETAAPSASASSAAPTATDRRDEGDVGTSSGEDGGGLVSWLPAVAAVLAVLALVVAPRVLRAGARRRRYAAGSADSPEDAVEGAWAEVRATALDLRRGWDDGETLRQRARALRPLLGSATDHPDARGALERLVALLERARYSRAGVPQARVEDARAASRTVCAALHGTARPRVQRRATWLPASLWRGRPQRAQPLLPAGDGTAADVDAELVSR